AFVFTVLFSSLYIFHEAEHECSGEDCEICFCLQLIAQNMSHLHEGRVLPPVVVIVFTVVLFCISISNSFFVNTPVREKVRLNN
ncbi:hypothetical protein, partial [Treponema sp.]|uniref:hypothetical protein n=1 Tax=Treponema sp. TaxID=166 RepID=UPI0025F12C1B